ncbi:MAG: hypothetical protein U1E86_04530 [Burkholderiaceae bacterium]
MTSALDPIAAEAGLDLPARERLRFEFGFACTQRVGHLLEDPAAVECLGALGAYLAGGLDRARLDECAHRALRLANGHPGSKSIDGCGHAAVSATYAVANALAGKARQAADYAAYAAVYAAGGYGAVADRASFAPEHAWQAACLARLAGEHGTR